MESGLIVDVDNGAVEGVGLSWYKKHRHVCLTFMFARDGDLSLVAEAITLLCSTKPALNNNNNNKIIIC